MSFDGPVRGVSSGYPASASSGALPKPPRGPAPGSAPRKLKVADSAGALVVYPGDTLVLRVAPDTSPEEFDNITKAARIALPDVKVVVVAVPEIVVIRGEQPGGE